MTEPMLRGYLLQRATGFIDQYFSPEQSAKIRAGFPEPLRAVLADIKPAAWYPREHCVTLHDAIASASNGPDAAYESLVACGEFMATEATNTYLRLVMRLMTPGLFCKKVPSFWQRDHSLGEFLVDNVDNEAKQIDMRLRNVAGFNHVGASCVGFLRFGMKAVGANAKFQQTGWSLANPAPAEIKYQVTWT